jgi:hypothetical protein
VDTSPPADVSWVDVATVLILGGQLVILAVAAFFGLRQAQEARKLREQRIRPFVVVDFEPDHFMFFFSVSNIGTALARDVKITIDPELTSSIDAADEKIAALRILNEGIPTLPPGKSIRTLFDSSISRDPKAGFPDAYDAAIEYTDENRRRHFKETIVLDLGIYWGIVPGERKDIHDLHKPLSEISKTLEKWSATGGGLLRVSPADVRERLEAWRARRADRHASQEEPQAEPDE